MSARRQEPVTEKVERPEMASMSLTKRLDVCPRSAFLYLKHKGGAQSAAMARGEAFHDFAERALNMLVESGEYAMPGEVAKDVMQAVLDERTDLVVPAREQEVCRIAAWNWAHGVAIDPATVAAIETTFEAEVAGWSIRGRIDLAEVLDGQIRITDWKTSLAVESVEDYENDWQAIFYALLVSEGRPEGEELGIGQGVDDFHLRQSYPRHRTDDGALVTRSTFIDRARLFDFRRTLESHLAKLDHGLATGEWPAVPGSHCATCACPAECPIPSELREVRSIATPGEASEVAERVLFLDSEASGLKKSLRAWADENGAVPVGSDLEFAFSLTESDRLIDKDGLFAFLDEHDVPRDRFYKHTESTRFAKRKVKEAA